MSKRHARNEDEYLDKDGENEVHVSQILNREKEFNLLMNIKDKKAIVEEYLKQ